MAIFEYRYIDAKGKKKTGRIEAIHAADAKEKLRAQQLTVISIQESKKGEKHFWKKEQGHLKAQELITFTTQLSQLLAAGVPLYESLLSLEEQYRSEAFHLVILNLCEQIKGGSSLSDAMGRHPESFNRLYCAMVAAGESVGGLDLSLEKLATLLNKQHKLKKQLITALLYPSVLCAFSMVVIFLLLLFVIPSLEVLFEDRDVNRFTKMVMYFSHFLTRGWAIYLPLLMGAAGGVIWLVKSLKGKRWLQKNLLKVPFLKTVITETAMARFSRTMGTLLQGGVTIIQALQISRKVMKNPFLEQVLVHAEARIIEGSLLSKELKKSPLIPSLVPRMLAIGEEGGNSALMFQKVADFYEEEVEKALSRLTALAQPVILVIMGGVVGFIMLAVLLPLTDVSAFL